MHGDVLPLTIFFGLVGAVLFGAFIVQRNHMRRLEEVLRALASRVDGQVRAGRWLIGRPSLLFGIRAQPARFEFNSTTGVHPPVLFTDLIVGMTGQPLFPVKLAPEGVLSTLGKLSGRREVQLGDTDFDPLFSIQSSDEPRLRTFLSPRVRRALLALRSLEGADQVWVGLAHEELRVRKLGWMQEEDHARRFLELGTQVVEGYLDALGARTGSERREPADEEVRSPGR
jgi:hypothetical protein